MTDTPTLAAPSSDLFDAAAFGRAVEAKLKNDRMSYRDAAPSVPCSPATLNRVARGFPPDAENYLRITRWLTGAPTPAPAPTLAAQIEALAPCPKCTGVAELRVSTDGEAEWARCTSCGHEGPVRMSSAAAIAAWNTRPAIVTALRQGEGQAPRDKAIAAMRDYVTSAGVPVTEFDPEFVVRMMGAMMVSFHKYGRVADAYPLKMDAAGDVRARMAKYRQTGNKHYLVDAANFAMIEAMHPGREAEWGGNSAGDSPGRTTASGHRLVQEDNAGNRIMGETILHIPGDEA